MLITPINTPAAEPVQGRIELITHQIDPSTRLLNVFVRPELNQTLLHNENQVGVISADLKAQDEVVVTGNYELESGMSVAIHSSRNQTKSQ